MQKEHKHKQYGFNNRNTMQLREELSRNIFKKRISAVLQISQNFTSLKESSCQKENPCV
jgi:hypothetical protein